jgi:excisionase family DNA binding protein
MTPRFLTREQVAEELNISKAQLYALLRRGDLRHIKIGGRGLYRIGRDDLAGSGSIPTLGRPAPKRCRRPGRLLFLVLRRPCAGF